MVAPKCDKKRAFRLMVDGAMLNTFSDNPAQKVHSHYLSATKHGCLFFRFLKKTISFCFVETCWKLDLLLASFAKFETSCLTSMNFPERI